MHGRFCQEEDSLLLIERNKMRDSRGGAIECFKEGECEIKLGVSVIRLQKGRKQVLNDKTEDNFSGSISDLKRCLYRPRGVHFTSFKIWENVLITLIFKLQPLLRWGYCAFLDPKWCSCKQLLLEQAAPRLKTNADFFAG